MNTRSIHDVETLSDIFLINLFNIVSSIDGETFPNTDWCSGKILATLFYEYSTRTNMSFQTAMQRCGGSVIDISVESSSVQKGETLDDTIVTLASYVDVIVLRHPEVGASKRVTTTIPILNAGDGIGQHPTQAISDLYTILKFNPKAESIGFVGDLARGRTVHSLYQLLRQTKLVNVKQFYFFAPEELQWKNIGSDDNTKTFTSFDNKDILKELDILYVTRIQKERGTTMSKNLKVDTNILKCLKKSAIVMHPFPRVDELATECDSDQRCVYLTKQIRNGMLVRMALLAWTTGHFNF